MVSRKREVMCEMFITSGQEWAVSRKYLAFRCSLHFASSLSNTSVEVVCFSALQQQADGYHVTAFRSCIGVEPSQDDFQKCACGATSPNTCVDTSYSCNCDANIGSSWHEDSGNLTDKNHLPVIQLRFGDTGSGEAGYHTLGKLRCYGMA